MAVCVPFETEGQRLVQAAADLYEQGGTREQWRSLACDLASRVAILEVKLGRVQVAEQVLTALADRIQLDQALHLFEEAGDGD